MPRSQPSPPPSPSDRGMTLVELMIAVLITVILAFLAWNLFSTTSSASHAGIARSTVIQEVYVAETRLRMDFASLIGPSSTADSAAGAIVVIPALRNGVMPVPGKPNGVPVGKLRSDQLAVFYDARNGGLIRNTGNGKLLKSLTRVGVASAQAKIWYGHVQSQTGDSSFAPSWTVGRQATLLVDPNPGTLNVPSNLAAAAGAPASDPVAPFSPINTASLSSDIAPFSLAETADWMRAAGRTDADMIAAFAVTPNDNTNYTNQPTVVTQPLEDNVLDASDLLGSYRNFMLNRSELSIQYSVDQDANGLVDTVGASSYTGTIQWMPKDSDIYDATSANHAAAMKAVVFYPQDDQVRVVHYGYYQGPALPNPPGAATIAYRPKPTDPTQASATPAYWKNKYGDWTPYPPLSNPLGLANGTYQFGDGLSAANYATAMSAYAARHNNWKPSAALPPVQSKWPQLVRVRYRVHDSQGVVYSVNDELTSNKRDDDGDGVVDNPEESRCCGLFVEHIFSTPYPRAN